MFGNAILRTYCHETEDEEKVEKAIKFFSANITKTKVGGFHGNKIIITEARLSKKQAKEFFERLKEFKEEILTDLEIRIDEQCYFYLRFDKQVAFRGKLKKSLGEDVIFLKAKILCFPSNKKNALKELADFFKN